MPKEDKPVSTQEVQSRDPREEDRYDAQRIEAKWHERWQQHANSLYAAEANSSKPKYYVLEMLPYPSGALHMGHVRNYSIGDALARYMWMNGYNVLHPMGWDSFGLARGKRRDLQQHSAARMDAAQHRQHEAQMKRLGFAYDWSREVTTCLPDYYRWNQWFFLKLYEKGLAYRKKSKVNWCPKCATVLANEQVVGGCCWRHEDTLVEQRELEQWFLRTTHYADELLRDLEKLDGLAGKSPHHAAQLDRPQRRRAWWTSSWMDAADADITVFTTRVDTIYGATSIQLAPEHPLVKDFAAKDAELRAKWTDDRRAAQSQRTRRPRRDREAWRQYGTLRGQSLQRRKDSRLGGELHSHGLRHRRDHVCARRTMSATSSLQRSMASKFDK